VANKNGIAAKYFCEGFFIYFKPTAPTVVKMAKDAKLAVVEKHIFKENRIIAAKCSQ
jgi:hypothetical protein